MEEKNQVNAEAPRKRITQKWWFWVIIALCGIVVFSAIVGETSSDSPSQTEETTEKPTLETETPIDEATYKQQCKWVSYFELSHYPNKYLNNDIRFTGGQIAQVIEDGNSITLLVYVSKDEYGFYTDDTVYVSYTRKSTDPRILEGDTINMYGTFGGLVTYTSVRGEDITVPYLDAKVVVIIG